MGLRDRRPLRIREHAAAGFLLERRFVASKSSYSPCGSQFSCIFNLEFSLMLEREGM
jgi:hypothetical protein